MWHGHGPHPNATGATFCGTAGALLGNTTGTITEGGIRHEGGHVTGSGAARQGHPAAPSTSARHAPCACLYSCRRAALSFGPAPAPPRVGCPPGRGPAPAVTGDVAVRRRVRGA